MGRMCAFVPRMMQHKAVARANIGKDLTPRGTQCPEAETLRGKKLAKEYQDKAMDMYSTTKKMLEKKVANLKKVGSKIDESKYMDLVNEVIDEVKSDGTVTAEVAKKLSTQLRNDWDMVKTELNK